MKGGLWREGPYAMGTNLRGFTPGFVNYKKVYSTLSRK